MKKIFPAAAFASLLFVACGGDDNNSVSVPEENFSLKEGDFSCSVESRESWARQTIAIAGEFEGYSEMTIKGSSAIASVKNQYLNRTSSELEKLCEQFEDQSDDFDEGSFKCADGIVTYSVTIPKRYANSISNVVMEMEDECYDYKEDWQESRRDAKSSSSAAKIPSSSSVKSSSSIASSSSMEKSSSSSQTSSSSQEKIACPEKKSVTLDSSIVAAYEFNDPNNLGKDELKLNDAKVGIGSPEGDCDNLVLDGKSGLVIPLSDIFKSKGFVVEARVYPEKFNTMQNILVSEPPGSSYSGWQLRLDNGEVTFHVRDVSLDRSKWTVFNAGEIPLNAWSEIRVERYPSGKILIRVNGEVVVDGNYDGNEVNERYDLGLGYDAMNQDRSSERYFVGKMDYVRFGIIKDDEKPTENPSVEARLIEDESTGRMKVAALDETLECPVQEIDSSYKAFTVAYEFNDVGDLGLDYVGNNHALFGKGAPDGNCSSLVLDGKSGLKIPFSSDFASKGVDIGARFKLSDVSGTSFIFGTNSGSGLDGWQIIVMEGKVYFNAKDSKISERWELMELESVEADQWISARVKIFPAKAESSDEIFYTVNIIIDGYIRKAVGFKGDLGQLGTDLSVGYNLENGGSEFAKGEIDYVRFAALSEDAL